MAWCDLGVGTRWRTRCGRGVKLKPAILWRRYTKTYMWDVSDLESPTLMRTYYSSQRSIDHNQYILGDLTYQSNYKVRQGGGARGVGPRGVVETGIVQHMKKWACWGCPSGE